MTRRDIWARRACVLRYYRYKDALLAQLGDFELGDSFKVVFVIATKKRSLWGKPHQLRPDIDNLTKSFLDSLMKEDKTIYRVDASKEWGESGRVIVENY
jgi:Holliday junction resolvase RusA-like endonuclease